MGAARRSYVRLIVAGLCALGADRTGAEVQLGLVSAAPARPHLVAAGTSTTFVISTHNTTAAAVTVSLGIEPSASSGDWKAVLFAADGIFRPVGTGSGHVDLPIPPGETVNVLARLEAGPSLTEGAEGGAVVSALVQGSIQATLELAARVRNRPKVFYVAMDGCGAGYLQLDRKGTRFDGTGQRLMPRAWAWSARTARMSRASGLLPATTDANHAAVLTGSWPGTVGIFSVKTHYLGQDHKGKPIIVPGTKGLMRWGLDGAPIQNMFDLAKDPSAGGAAAAFTAIVSGKRWLSELFQGEGSTLDLAVSGASFPSYVPPPQPYRLGDPPSDDNRKEDREGTNRGPWLVRRLFNPLAVYVGRNPQKTPDDRWTAEAAIRILQAEDPDVLYTNLAECDTVQHIFGAADRPEEWIDRGTPNVLWDDENVYNKTANRDPVLDVVHEADEVFGQILDALQARQVLDRAFVILLSDHGQATVMKTPDTVLDVGKILLAGGLAQTDVERIVTSGEMGWIALKDPAKKAQISAILQQHQETDPVLKKTVNPFLVLDRDEMDSGIDDVDGPFAEDGVPGNKRGELYSEWSIDGTRTDLAKVRWPDLFIFMRNRFQTAVFRSDVLRPSRVGALFNGQHGSRLSADVIMAMSGPGIAPGVYDGAATLADISPTLYRLLGIPAPAHVDGKVLEEVLSR